MTEETGISADEEAIAWFVLLRDEDVSEADHDRFRRWLKADPAHPRAWQSIEGIWSGLDRLGPDLEVAPRPAERQSDGGPVPAASRSGAGTWRLLVAAAAVLLLIGASGIWSLQPAGYAVSLFADYSTAAGEVETVVLADRSTITLGASSALSVSYDNTARRITLHRGEAFYEVVRDPGRPFTVSAAEGEVTVTGTAFDVKRSRDSVAVSVAEGSVEVAPASHAPLHLKAGQAVRYDSTGAGPVRKVDLASIAAWRADRLVFHGAPLEEVLDDLERYFSGTIVITDNRIARLPVTGAFDTHQPEAALDTIDQSLPVELIRFSDLLIVVRPAP